MTSQKNPNSLSNNSGNTLTKALFVIYLAVLVWILIFKLGVTFSYMETRSINLIPFAQLLVSNGKPDIMEMILNVLIFVPLGIYVGAIGPLRLTTKLLVILLCSIAIESTQYLFKIGAFDITDIITNTSGGVVGLLLFWTTEKIFNDRTRAQKVINVLATIGTVAMVTFLLLLKLNMLPIRYQ